MNTEELEELEIQVCCVCGLPAEGELECDCECHVCGVHVFDDVTLVDHGECLTCHRKRLMGELGEDEE